MSIRHWYVIAVAALLSACATRGPLDLGCNGFAAPALKPGPVVQSIIADRVPTGLAFTDIAPSIGGASVSDESSFIQDARAVLTGEPFAARNQAAACARLDPIMRALVAHAGACGEQGPRIASAKPPVILALSGGGQWGAFGAAYLETLAAKGQAPAADIITGISTGAMQALLLADYSPDRYHQLRTEYAIKHEREIVDRGSEALAVLTGSVAGLGPLTKKIERVLCSEAIIAGARGQVPDCLLTRLADRRAARVSVAFVQADTGELMIADINALAALYSQGSASVPLPDRLRTARRCVMAAAVASSAMPAFYQQVRIGPVGANAKDTRWRTVLDGGVRQSVFLPAIASRVHWFNALTQRTSSSASFYVIRNGPTTGKLDQNANAPLNVLQTARRSYDIVVNQLELGSLAALRAEYASAPIAVATADGASTEQCLTARNADKKRRVRMFDPDFMLCLQGVGVEKAARSEPWLWIAPVPK